MDQQIKQLQKSQTLQTVKEPFFVSETYIQPVKNKKQPQSIENQDLVQYEDQTKPEQQSNQQQEYQPLDSYIISKTLGKGSFGKVKLAMHKITRQYVAVKILQKDLIFQNTDIVRITRQLKIMKKLRHPFVVQLYQIIETAKQLYLIMEYAEGGDLFEKIVNDERIKQTDAARIYTQIVLGMDYFHSKGVTHRDLKPQNILMLKDGTIKIADFGLGNTFKPEEKLKTACGSPCYASPQMLNREPYDPKKVDIWSSGIILYAMVCGYLPFEDAVTSKLYDKIKTSNIKLPSWVSGSCRNLIRGVLTKDPKLRYDAETILSHQMIVQHAVVLNQIVRQKQLIENKIQEICQMYDIEEKQKLVADLNKNRHNNLTTLYYLAVRRIQKLEKEGITGNVDMIDLKRQKQIKSQKVEKTQVEKSTINDTKTELVEEIKEDETSIKDIQIQQQKQKQKFQIQQNKEVQVYQDAMQGQKNQKIDQEMKQEVFLQTKVISQNQQIMNDQKKDQTILQNRIEQQQKSIDHSQKLQYQHDNEPQSMQIEQNKNQQDQHMLSDDELQVHRLHEEIIYQQKDSPQNYQHQMQIQNSQKIQNYQQKQTEKNEFFAQQPPILVDQNVKEAQIQPNMQSDQNATIRQSYQLSMEIQQTLQQLNKLSEINQIQNQYSQNQQQTNIQIQQFQTLSEKQVIEPESEKINEQMEQNQKLTEAQIILLQKQNQQIQVQAQELTKNNQNDQVETELKNISQQFTQNQQKNQNQQQNTQVEALLKSQKSQYILPAQTNGIQNKIQGQIQKLPLIQSHEQEQTQLVQQILNIENFIPKKKLQNSQIQTKFQTKPQKQENKLLRQNNKKNHLFSTDQVLSLKQKVPKIEDSNQNEITQNEVSKKSTNIQSKDQARNIITARNIRLNERSHSKDAPIVFKSNKNKFPLKSQFQKQENKKKSLSKEKKFKAINQTTTDSKRKNSQQKLVKKNEKKQIPREKFVIAKDKKPQKNGKNIKKQQIKNQNIGTPKSQKILKNVNELKQQTKIIKNFGITEIKQQPEAINKKFQNKIRLKSSSLILQGSKKFSDYGARFNKNIIEEGKEQNVPISPISGMKTKEVLQTFSSTKMSLQNLEHKSLVTDLRQQQQLQSSPISQRQEGKKGFKKIQISKPNVTYGYVKTKSFSQYSNFNSTITNGSSPKIQLSKYSQNSPNQNKFNKTMGSFSYRSKESVKKQEFLISNEKSQLLDNFGINSTGGFDKAFSSFDLKIKQITHENQQNFVINFSTAEPQLVNPQFIIFLSVQELYHLIASISRSKSIKFTDIIGSLTIYQYSNKDYLYVLNSNLFKSHQILNDEKKSHINSLKKKTQIGTFEFVELINSIVMTN